MSESDTGQKPKPTLVRLGQNGTPPSGRLSFGSPRTGAQVLKFKADRDLTLGAKLVERKKFVPNLNVQRQVKKEGGDEGTKVKTEKGADGRRHRKDKKHERRDNKHSKERTNLIQTGSVFSDGIAGDGGLRRRAGGHSYGGGPGEGPESGGGMQRPKLELNTKFDKEAEEERLKRLLRDDFIDDLKEGSFVPVQLPMIDTGKIFNDVKKLEKLDTQEDESNIKSKLLNRQAILDSDDDEEAAVDDPKPPASLADPPSSRLVPPPDDSVAELVRHQHNEIFFIQLPDHLPSTLTLPSSPSTSTPSTPKPSSSSEQVSLSRLQEGEVGRLQVRRSGRCQLVMGSHTMDLEVGTKVGFLQDAVSVRTPAAETGPTTKQEEQEEEGGTGSEPSQQSVITVQGQVRQRLVVSPDWDNLLRLSGLKSDLA